MLQFLQSYQNHCYIIGGLLLAALAERLSTRVMNSSPHGHNLPED